MVDATRFTEFTKTAQDKLELVRFSLLRHDKNPDDREFLNDISRSIRAIKDASFPAGLGRVPELCFHLESMLTLIRRNRLEINHEIITLLQDGKDRLAKLLHEIETMQKERATVKDLLKRIKKFENSVADDETMEPAPALEVLEPEIKEKEIESDQSLLPEEIKNEEYDRELFQIFIDQMQENLSLLRSLTNGYPDNANKAKGMAICSNLVGKLQTSANYMGYEELADFYLQWIAELEMSGVELSIGTPVSLDYMETHLQKITALFPQIRDVPAEEALVNTTWQEFSIPVPEKKEPREVKESLKDLFNDMDEPGDLHTLDTEFEPIAALSGTEVLMDESPQPEKTKPGVKKITRAAPVTIDSSFLEEEKQSSEFDEELFQIFLQQLQENLSQIRSLTDQYPEAPNKSNVVDHCSRLVGNLQSSANYMGYSQLAEYHLQWIAELELAGVDLSIGNEISFDFMDGKIQKIIELFPQIENMPSEAVDSSIFEQQPLLEKSPVEAPIDSKEDDFDSIHEMFDPKGDDTKEDIADRPKDPDQPAEEEESDFLFGEFNDGTEESFEFDAEPIAALTDEESPDEIFFNDPADTGMTAAVDSQADEDIGALFLGDDHSEPDDSGSENISENPLVTAVAEELFTDFAGSDENFDVSSATSEEIPVDTTEEMAGMELDNLFEENDSNDATLSGNSHIHKELFQKLSSALKSLDNEPIPEEPSPEDTSQQNEDDTKLYEKLLGALETTPGDDTDNGANPINQVIEEILTGEPQPGPAASVSESASMQLNTPEIWHSLGFDANKVDDLMNKIGELVTNRSSLSQLQSEMSTLHHNLLAIDGMDTQKLAPMQDLISRLGNANTALGRIFGEIKDGILKVRMTPIGRLFDLYEKSVPELAAGSGKKINFTHLGNETEIDHCTLDDMATCLLILIRNAIEHGIETPLEREQSGKEPTASLTLNAYHEQNHVVLEITDDGRGIDPKKIKAVALANDLFSGDELYKMSDNDLTRLIMIPGFSTDPKKTEPSLGMDMLKTTVERLNGTVLIKSSVGGGTSIRLRIPFHSPDFQTLQFSDGSSSYAVPLTSIDEVLRVKEEDLVQSDDTETILLRDDAIPVFSLSDLIETAEPTAERSARFYVIIVSDEDARIGLIVNSITGPEDVSIRPLAQFLKDQSGFSAAAIKGEGEISFIPDITGLIKKASEAQLQPLK